MTIRTLCSEVVATASPQETIRTAARRMATNDLGTLVVVRPNDGEKPIGFLTDRDLMMRCIAEGVDPDAGLVLSVMSQPVHCLTEHAPLEEAIRRMAKFGTRRLVLTNDEGRMVGVLSLDDILLWFTNAASEIGSILAKQQPLVAV
jgi:CBS domain-containing protein